LNLDKETTFGSSNSYKDSLLKQEVDKWYKELPFKASLEREVEGSMVAAAPLSFEEYNKYLRLIGNSNYVYNYFWLSSGWKGSDQCCVVSSGVAYNYSSNSVSYIAPALYVPKKVFVKAELDSYSTQELLEEIGRRVK
jgi:hypothetical protein